MLLLIELSSWFQEEYPVGGGGGLNTVPAYKKTVQIQIKYHLRKNENSK